MVVGEIASQDAAEMSLVEHEHMIQALASDRTDELHERVLPRALRRRENVLDLLGRPRRGGMLGDIEVYAAATTVDEHDEDEEDAEPSGWHGEEVARTVRASRSPPITAVAFQRRG
jgi:hypothetical protein